MEERLAEIYKQIAEWLRFAEVKNSALFAANLVIVFGIFQTGWITPARPLISSYLIYVVSLLLVSSGHCLTSFMPTLTEPAGSNCDASPTGNLLFFGCIADHEPSEYLAKVYEAAGLSGTPSRIEQAYADQIVINSRIASQKYALFNTAIWITFAALLSPLAALIAWWYKRR